MPDAFNLIWYLDLEDGSYIFPSESDLNAHLKKKQRPGKTCFSKSIQYKSILSEVMRFFVSGLGILNRYFGTHIFRFFFISLDDWEEQNSNH